MQSHSPVAAELGVLPETVVVEVEGDHLGPAEVVHLGTVVDLVFLGTVLAGGLVLGTGPAAPGLGIAVAAEAAGTAQAVQVEVDQPGTVPVPPRAG